MGLAYNTYLNSNRIYGCKNCKAHLANHEDIISRVRLSPLRPGGSLPERQPERLMLCVAVELPWPTW